MISLAISSKKAAIGNQKYLTSTYFKKRILPFLKVAIISPRNTDSPNIQKSLPGILVVNNDSKCIHHFWHKLLARFGKYDFYCLFVTEGLSVRTVCSDRIECVGNGQDCILY